MAEEVENREENQKEEKKSNLMMIIIAGVFVVILIIGAILAFLISGGSEEEEMMEMANSEMQESRGGDQSGELRNFRRKTSLTVGPMFEMDTFIVNLLSENGRRYLKVKVNLELEDEALQEEVTQKIPVIRDIVIRIASSKNLEEISTENGKNKFKDQIVSEINRNLQDGKINNVFFTDFVIQ
jgi:flagellar FliL protein